MFELVTDTGNVHCARSIAEVRQVVKAGLPWLPSAMAMNLPQAGIKDVPARMTVANL